MRWLALTVLMALMAALLIPSIFGETTPAIADDAAKPWKIKIFAMALTKKEHLEKFEGRINDWLTKNVGKIQLKQVTQSNSGLFDLQTTVAYQERGSTEILRAKVFAGTVNVIDNEKVDSDLTARVNEWLKNNAKIMTPLLISQSSTHQMNSMHLIIWYKYGTKGD